MVKNTGGDFTLTYKWGDSRTFDSNGYITSVQESYNTNAAFTYVYDGSNRIQKVVDEYGRESTFTFDTNGKLSSVNDFFGRTTDVTVTSGRLDSVTVSDETATGYTAPTWSFDYRQIGTEYFVDEITNPAGHTTEYLYLDATRRIKQINNPDHTTGDPSSWLLYPTIGEGIAITSGSLMTAADADARYVDEEGNIFRFETDQFGNMVSQTDALGATSYFEYDNQGWLYKTIGIDPDGSGSQLASETLFGYSSDGDLVYTENADGTTSTATYDATLHLVTSTTNELGESESFTYDSVGNLLTHTDLRGNTWTYTYDSHGNVLTMTSPDPDGAETLYSAITTTYTYDSTYYNRLTKTTFDNGEFQEWTYTTSDMVATATDELGNVTSYEYDPLDRQTKMTLPDPDGSGALLSPVYTYTYGSNLLLASETDPLGNVTSYEYDSRRRLTKTTLPDPDGSGTLTSPEYTTSYDKVGNVVSVTRPEYDGVSTSYVYNGNGQVTSVTGPVSGQTTSYTYDDAGRLTSTTDASGRVVSYEYDIRNRITKIIDHDPDGSGPEIGPTNQFVYDDLGQLIEEIDPLGRSTAYTYFEDGLLATQTRPDPDRDGPESSPVHTYEYDAIGRLKKTTTPSGRNTQNEYNIFGQVTKFTDVDPDGTPGNLSAPVTDYVYDEVGQLTSSTNALGHVTSYTYDNLGRTLTVTLPDPDDAGPKSSPVQSHAYDAAGNLTSTTDALGRTTTYAYDDLYRMTSATRPDPDGTGPLSSPVVSYQYNDQGLLASKTDPLSRVTSYAYDSAGRLTSTTDPGNNTSSIAYDLLDRVTSQTSPDPDGSGPLTASVTTFNYDIYSRFTSTVDAAGKSTTNEYDIVGQRLSLTDASGNTTRWAYDDLGRMTMETDERGHTRTFNHNVVDRLVRMTDRNGRITRYANSGLDLKEYWYERTDDPHTTVATVTQGSTGVNEVQTVTISNLSEGGGGGGGVGGPGGPGGGGGGAGGGDPVDFFRIAFDGQVTEPIASTADASDVEAALEDLVTVDDVQVTHSGDVFTITFVGDHAGTDVDELMADVYFGSDGDLLHELTITQDALYRMIGVDDDYADYTYTLDNLGRLTNLSETITGLTPTIELDYDYDAVGNRLSQSATIGTTLDFLTEFEYDDLNRFTNVSRESQTGGNAVADLSVEFAYNALGQYSQIDRYEAISGTNPSLQSVYQYDTANRLSSLTHQHSPTSGSPIIFHGYTYSYDAMDRFVSIDSTVDGLSSFTFDKLSQLTDADHDSSRADEDYDYDDTGNRNNTGFTIGDDNLTTSDGAYNYEYDEEGNRTKRTEISSGDYEEYEWDHRNRLTKVSRFDVFGNSVDYVAYSYDIFNRMVRRTYDGDGTGGNGPTDQFFAGFNGKHGTLEFDDDQAADVSHRYLWNGEVLIADEVVTSTSTAGDLQWALTDHVGTIRDIAAWDSNSSEFEVNNHRVYNSFGLLESETDPTVDLAFAFTSQWTDEITGLTHHLNRWFDPNLGKWLSDDPLSFDAGDVNLQRYVANQPLSFVDPTGLVGTNSSAASPLDGGIDQGWEAQGHSLSALDQASKHFWGPKLWRPDPHFIRLSTNESIHEDGINKKTKRIVRDHRPIPQIREKGPWISGGSYVTVGGKSYYDGPVEREDPPIWFVMLAGDGQIDPADYVSPMGPLVGAVKRGGKALVKGAGEAIGEAIGDALKKELKPSRYTEPTLPNKTIVNEKGVKIEHYTRSNDHPPAHAHVKGEGPHTRIGANGKVLDGDPELSSAQKKVIEGNKSLIRSSINKIRKWWKWNLHLDGGK